MIKLVIFDLWDTLAHKYTKVGGIRYLKKLTHSNLSREEFSQVFEKSTQIKKWGSKYKAYSNFCKAIKLPVTDENIKLLMDARDYAESKTKAFPHSIAMLKKLKKKYKVGMISNTSIFAIQQLKKRTKLLDYIDYFLPSYVAGTIKPDPNIFKKMLKIAKVKPRETIMIGDSLNSDVIPSRKLGMNAIRFRNIRQLKKDFASYKIRI